MPTLAGTAAPGREAGVIRPPISRWSSSQAEVASALIETLASLVNAVLRNARAAADPVGA
jgi:hypothetical protein